MKKKWYRIANSSLSALLVLLGFEACTGMENGGEEYGTPTVDFHVVGQVTDAEGKPIEGIRVTTRGYYDFNDGTMEQTTYTDKEGRYATKEVKSIGIDPGMKVVFEDVDGEANGGLFAADSVSSGAMAKEKVKKGDGNWYEGGYELTANAKLKPEVLDHE
jgi:putative lipoprotein (rSAM/lipoprotein system)